MIKIDVFNKRKSIRIESALPVLYKPSIHQNWYMTNIKGLGIDGICMLSSEHLSNGTIVKLRFLLPGSQVNTNVVGEVLWSGFLIDRKLFESGVRFIRLDNVGKELIANYVDGALYPQSDIAEIQVIE